ncbi:hypothetical protein AVEN_59739-1 [Araneus ventricosus]|uniref:Uncharacterized protein n=1 Tax=Araneus ventricosus TaxID=182803 RepID=A0A4Y2BPC4_ARAVE|nr:hypothetical protein AVEN_59739-1 [Araneus ventricosus]
MEITYNRQTTKGYGHLTTYHTSRYDYDAIEEVLRQLLPIHLHCADDDMTAYLSENKHDQMDNTSRHFYTSSMEFISGAVHLIQ